ncbi:MAG TPA: histidinol dehydrogenase [Candidatus Baltobacteraceae bacterium]|jgi:histidinol dehydrogenase|nr:histidinol dehydrogenase [Candidatus Baltobacteraceae bacterium]
MQFTALRRVSPEDLDAAVRTQSRPGVAWIVDSVQREGDAAVARIAAELGDPPPRRIPAAEIESAHENVQADLFDALEGAAARIERFARAQRASLHDVSIQSAGAQIGHRIVPVGRAGVYVPAGRHPLVSSMLMCAIPARVAGVAQIVACTPKADAVMLTAARIARVDAVFEIGGAQAIAALAFGTQTVPRVDIIAGPGNAYVDAAKRLVNGACGIDGFAGPSEVLLLASRDGDPNLVAADLLAQAEHDADARAMLITDSGDFAEQVDAALVSQLALLRFPQTAMRSLTANGTCTIARLSDGVEIADRIGAEHVGLHGKAAEALADRLSVYGSLFAGAQTSQVFGDYGIGPNHVLPTGGSARYNSGLSVLTFLTVRTYQRAARVDASVVHQIAKLAQAEGLQAHRAAALARAAEETSYAVSSQRNPT